MNQTMCCRSRSKVDFVIPDYLDEVPYTGVMQNGRFKNKVNHIIHGPENRKVVSRLKQKN